MVSPSFEIEQAGQTLTVRFADAEITHTVMQEAATECTQRMRYDNAHDIVFDLQGVAFLASACLGSLVALLQDVEHVRGRIWMTNCCDAVAFIFKVTRLDHVFTMQE